MINHNQDKMSKELSVDRLNNLTGFFKLLFTVDRRLKITDKYVAGLNNIHFDYALGEKNEFQQ